MEDGSRYCTLRCNRNKSTNGALLAAISFRIRRISSCVLLNEVVPPFLAPLAFAEAPLRCNSPSMTSKPVVSATLYIDLAGESKVLIS
jgi:hypothetical protein